MPQVIALFCEDLREEKSGQLSLIGVLPDNINVPLPPPNAPPSARAFIPKLALYFRVHMGLDEVVKPMTVKLVLQNGEEISLGTIDDDLIAKAKADAAINRLPTAGIIHHAVIQGFSVSGAGLIVAAVDMGDQHFIGGVLNIRNEETPQTK